ncbi:calcium-binding protein [Microvirga roseola]|uniref:calcium-binding protein n=1 Tax=Microvirga roseola TaxID=2883126 RepID=UPI001E542D62|nr:calcium-binding protein [Microvirga roseola]
MATPQRWGTEILINGPGDNDEPHVTALADGRFVVAWVDHDAQEVRAQIINADGSPRGKQFTINTTSAGEQQLPNIAALADGRFVAVWTDQRAYLDDGENADIYGQIFSVSGTKIGTGFKINDGISVPPAHALVQPDITTLSDGGFAVTWRDLEDPAPGDMGAYVWVARYDADGDSVGPISDIQFTLDNENAKPAIQALEGGGYVVAWSQGTDTSAINLQAAIISSDGDGHIIQVAEDDPSLDIVHVHPQITKLTDGGFVVTWKVNDGSSGAEDYAVRAQVFDADGTARGIAFEVSSIAGVEVDPVVTALNDGRFMIAWADYHVYASLSTEVKGQVYQADGVKDGEAFTIHTPHGVNDRMPSISTLVDGRVVVSWWHDGEPTIRTQIIDPREAGITMAGTSLNDDYVGTRFIDELNGGQGSDQFDGGAGADVINGGDGIDTVTFSSATQRIVASLTGGTGGDANGDVYTSIERLIGSRFGDKFYGSGAAILQGAGGNDTYYISGSDQVIETASGGTDTVVFSGSLKLPAYVENLVATGSASISLAGNSSSNALIGNAGRNTLKGEAGSDHLDGKSGADVMYGGAGNDTFYVDHRSDKAIEGSRGGTDTVVSYVSYKLGTSSSYQVEKLVAASGRSNLALEGNKYTNYVYGNSGNNKLAGGLGKDYLKGGSGKDTFIFDTKVSSSNVDKIIDFSSRYDAIWLDNKYFTKLGSGSSRGKKFSSDMFTVGTKAQDREDRVIYDKKKGVLYYDADGIGSKDQVKFAVISNKTTLGYDDFFVI